MEMEKKNLAIILLAVVLAASGVGNIFLGMQLGIIEFVAPPRGQDLVYGTFQGDIVYLDPHYAYDSASISILDQVVERLYRFNLTDPAYLATPWLASAMPSVTPNGLEYTIPLRTDVMFHDNTTMTAEDVKWSFDRLMYFCNYSGNQYLPAPFNVELPLALPSGVPTPTQLWGAIYMNPDLTPIINETIVVNANTVKFVLNQPRGAFFSILPFCGSAILSPDSTPALDYLALYEDLIGTGPFMYDSFTAGVEVKLSAFYLEGPDGSHIEYWQGRPQLDTITVTIVSTLAVLNQALLSGDIDILTAMDPAFLDQHAADPDVTLFYAGGTLTTTWIQLNVDEMNVAMREATAYSLNYSYVIDTIYERTAVRWPTYIPMGISYANYGLDYPIFNRTHAREVLLADATYGAILGGLPTPLTASSTDQDWIDVANGLNGGPIDVFNITWNFGNDLRGEVANRLDFDMSYVGVAINVFSRSWAQLLPLVTLRSWMLDMYTMGWGPDYLDPENYISPIWANTTLLNGGNYNAPDVQQLMKDGIVEVDLVQREAIYNEIQQKMVERDYPGMPLLTGLNYDAWRNEVVGFPSNAINNVWWYDVYLA